MIIGELPPLSVGPHFGPDAGKACVMEMVALLNGDEWSDTPSCTYDRITAVAQMVNDRLPDTARNLLEGQFDRLFGTSKIASDPKMADKFDRRLYEFFRAALLADPSGVTYNALRSADAYADAEDWDKALDYMDGAIYNLIFGVEDEKKLAILSAVLDLADEVLGRTEAPVVDVTPLKGMMSWA